MPSPGPVVLFSDVCGSTALYERQGDRAAFPLIRQALSRMSETVESRGGRVIKTIGDEVLALFSDARQAVDAATAIREAGPSRLQVRVGIHRGPVIEQDGDVFGDTVNVAARVVSLAKAGEVLMTREVVDALPPDTRRWTRRLPAMAVKGKAEPVGLYQLVLPDDEMTVVAGDSMSRSGLLAADVLVVRFGERQVRLDAGSDPLVLGRDPECSLVVARSRVSRRHATIERVQRAFCVRDHSTNGTWLVAPGLRMTLKRNSVTLPRAGRLWLGARPEEAAPNDAVEFLCS